MEKKKKMLLLYKACAKSTLSVKIAQLQKQKALTSICMNMQ